MAAGTLPPLDPQKQCLAYIPLTWHVAWLHGKNYEWLNAGLLWLYLPKENGILISTYSKASISQFLFQQGSYEIIIFSICHVVKTPRAAKNQNISNLEVAEMENKEVKIRDNIQDFHASL